MTTILKIILIRLGVQLTYIIDQSDCLFYGNVEFQNGSSTVSSPITGVITGKRNDYYLV